MFRYLLLCLQTLSQSMTIAEQLHNLDMGVASLEEDAIRDPDERMKKHSLNKRFNSQENLKFRTKKGAKRSKKK